MRFHIYVMQTRRVQERWTVEAENRDQAIEAHEAGNSDFDEEETTDTWDSEIVEVVNLTDPEGLLEVDEGL